MSSARLILLACWFGAALFFGAIVAPAAFSVARSFGLPNANEVAGSVVTRTLSVINIAAFVIALVLLLTAILRRSSAGRISFIVECVCLAVITIAGAVGQWVIAARMRGLRTAMALPIDQIAANDPRRIEFASLHGYSVNLLSLAMIAALVALVLMARSRS